MFLLHYKKKKKTEKKSFLQAAIQAFPRGLDETQLKNKEQKQKEKKKRFFCTI